MDKVKINPIDLEEVMVYLVEKRDEYENDNNFDIHQEFYEKFEVTSEQFEKLLSLLIPMIDIGVSPLSNKRYLMLADKENDTALLKVALETLIPNNRK